MIVIDNHAAAKGLRSEQAFGKRLKGAAVIFAPDGLQELAAWLERTPRRWTSQSSLKPPEQRWDLGLGWDGALRLAREGWSEGARDLANRLAVAMPSQARANRWTYDVAGEQPDTARYLAGDPMAMRRRGRNSGTKPVLHLIVNPQASFAISAQQMANFGAALVAMIDQIESSGWQIELDVISSSDGYGDRGQFAIAAGWNVKKAGGPVDLAAVAFSIGHPAAFRRFGFALRERTPRELQHHAYGYSYDLQPEMLPEPNPAAVIIQGLGRNTSRCRDMADALAFAAKQINQATGQDLVTITP